MQNPWKLNLFHFQVRESPAPINIPAPTPATDRAGPVACLSGPVANKCFQFCKLLGWNKKQDSDILALADDDLNNAQKPRSLRISASTKKLCESSYVPGTFESEQLPTSFRSCYYPDTNLRGLNLFL